MPSTSNSAPASGKASGRFDRKREQIITAATRIINDCGAKAMSRRQVADAVGLTTTSLAYYFQHKNMLIQAVFERRLDQLEAMVSQAETAPDTRAKVDRLLAAQLELLAKIRRDEALPLASLSDLAALDERLREALQARIGSVFKRLRAFFGRGSGPLEEALLSARSHMLIGLVFFLPTWSGQYSSLDFPRLRRRIMDVLTNGIAPASLSWTPQILELSPELGSNVVDRGRLDFLRAATRLMNATGYAGTSVDSIARELKVTKGSFYHHLDSKDELVLDCLRANYERVSRAITLAQEAGGNSWQQLSSILASTLDVQFEGEWPLLRSTAWASLPRALRFEIVSRSNRIAVRLAGLISDGIEDGSVRPVDALIAGQLVNSTINSAFDLQGWAARLPRPQAIALYASTLTHGLFDDRVLSSIEQSRR